MKKSFFAALCLLSWIAPAQEVVQVKIQPGKVLGTMAPEALGVGVAVWDDHMMDAPVPSLIKAAGFKVIRYPGGSYADIYHWGSHSGTKGLPFAPTIRPGVDFDRFMGLAKRSGATPLITVNYGTNEDGTGGADPKEAADWVRYANRTNHYKVRYWEIGNEIYGNGFYNGQPWEEDHHAPMKDARLKNPALGPVAYGQNVNAFVAAMKGVDSSIKIGAVLTGPGDWPHGVDPDWNSNVLKQCGDKIDFLVVHWYAWGKSPADVMASLDTVPTKLKRLRAEIDAYCGKNASHVQIWMTEGDASGYNTRPTGALFAAHHLLTWWESGATHVDWWDLHNGATKAFDGVLDDQGILSNGSSIGDLREPTPNTPFPPYFGVKMVSQMASPGDTFIAAASSDGLIKAHAVRRKDGTLAVMLINTSDQARQVELDKSGNATWLEYGPSSTTISKKRVKISDPVSVPATSIVDILFDK